MISFLFVLIGSAGAEGLEPFRSNLESLIFPPDYQTLQTSSSAEDLQSNGDGRGIHSGETWDLAEFEGPGMIVHIWITIGSSNPFYPRAIVLRIYWDGEEYPSVEAPLGDFFGAGHGARAEVDSVPVSVPSLGRSYNCFWKMPFRKSAKISLTNESEEYPVESAYFQIEWRKFDRPIDNANYFHAKYHQEHPAQPGHYVILETTGTGQYVGTVYSIRNMEMGWPGEGDDFIYIDGDDYPTLKGTGTEDFFGDAWGFQKFAHPYQGVSLWEGFRPGDRSTAFRWNVEDPIAFHKSIKVTFEHSGSVIDDEGVELPGANQRTDWLSSVGFWYQSPIVTFQEGLPPAKDRIAPYRLFNVHDLVVTATPSQGYKEVSHYCLYKPGVPDAEIAFGFHLEEAGLYQVNAYLEHTLFGGRYQAYLDGSPIGPVLDLSTCFYDPVWAGFDLHPLGPGAHVLSFKGLGSSPESRTYGPKLHTFGLEYLILLRLEDMTGYRAVLKSLGN